MSAQNQKVTGVLGAIAGMVGLSAVAGVLVTVMVTPALAVTGMAASNTIGIFESLPEYIKINEQTQRNVLYAQRTSDPADGYRAIATVYAENREEVGWDEVSQYIKDATVAGEDRRFYDHNGVDLQSIVRAAVGNAVSGGIESGASTLTMQLVKNIFITEALKAPTIEERDRLIAQAQEQSLERKLQEAKFAIGLEKEYTKDEILLAYLNIAGFGGNTYGIQAAAQQYFGVPASEVTIAQAASLIAIVQEPGARSLGTPENYAANQERRDVILGFMYGEGYITEAEYREAIAIPVDEEFVQINPPQSGCFAAHPRAKFFCDYVINSVKDFESLGATEEERLEAWRLGGYDVYTTLNLSLQNATQERMWEVVPANVSQTNLGGVAVQVENGTGRVLSMAINKRFDNRSPDFGGGKPGTTAVNYATDRDYGGSSGFQVGSTYKIFTLLEWLEQNRGLREVVDTTRSRLQNSAFQDTCEDGGGPHGGPWNVGNFGPAAPALSVWDATVQSVNTAFAAMAEQLDLCEIRRTAEAMGVHRADGDPLQTNPSAILGTNEIAPLTMAAAYAAIGSGGIFCEPIIVDRFIDRDGNELKGQEQECRRALSEEVAAAATGPMRDVFGLGTARTSVIGDGIPLIGKTGTTDAAVHTWMAGGSTKVTTVVWVGNVVGQYNITFLPAGTLMRHNVFRIAQAEANRQYGGGQFPAVPARLLNGSGVTLPDVAGLTAEQAKDLLEGLGFRFEIGKRVDSDLAEGLIVTSSPKPGTLLARGQTVKVSISRGNLIVVPNVSRGDLTAPDAIAALNAAGFLTISEICQELPEDSPPEKDNIVVDQTPKGGAKVKFGTAVTITVERLDCG
ncbi:MAG: transglycosylase domain-containing protein [Yonghaparkia sp.]|nr:transglycosylase domain-containing protein [Microcella sp.]